MGRPSTYEKQRAAAKAAREGQTIPQVPPASTRKPATRKAPAKKAVGGRSTAPPARPIKAGTTNLGPNGEVLFEVLLTPDQVSLWLGKPKSTLYAWRTRGQGPPALRVGSDLRYRRADVESWLESQVLGDSA